LSFLHKPKNNKQLTFICCLLLLTVTVCIMQLFGFERSFSIDLTSQDKISTRDDRVEGGSSISSHKVLNDGVNFSCQVKVGKIDWQFCELKFSLSSHKNGNVIGRNLSDYDRVGLWIDHDHKSQPGTRIELHNFSEAYSIEGVNDSLKYNTVEFFEDKVPTPTWINFHQFYVPTWWNTRHDLADGGTDFTNIHTISLTTGGIVSQGLYKLTVRRIEFRGNYIENDTLFFILTIVWSLVTGFFFRQLSLSHSQVISISKQKIKWQEAAFTDSLTGVNNRDSARNIFSNLLVNSNVLSLLFIDIDLFKKINDNFGHNIGDEILVLFSQKIMEIIDDSNVLIRWGGEEFLLLCPQYNLLQASAIAEDIRKTIESTSWVKGIKLTVSIGVAQKNQLSITQLISAADEALYKAKANGRNQVVLSNINAK
jgi:diguanylate cyclase (GGDEF)-like protein